VAYLYRAIDQYGQVVDVWLSTKRDLNAARTFFTRALATGVAPVEVTTNRAPAYPRVLDELIPGVLHDTKQYATTQSRQTIVASRPGYDPCAASRPSDQPASSPPVTRLYRTSDAATTRSPPTHQSTIESGWASMS